MIAMISLYDPIALFYDLSHDRLTADIPFLLDQAAQTGDPILELGCGSGRLLSPLARAGHRVIGIDNSAEMLARAEGRFVAEAQSVQERVRLLQADMTTFSLPDLNEPFGLAIFGYNTFMHLDESAAGRTMRRLRPLLRDGGRVIIDQDNPLTLASAADDPDFSLEEAFVDVTNKATVRQYTAYETVPGEQAVTVTWIYETTKPGEERPRIHKSRLRYHYLYPHQIELLLNLVGLKLLAIYGNYDGSPYDEESERMLVVGAAPATSRP